MSRRVSVLVLAGLLAAVAVAFAGVAVAHGNHASASPQVSANGSVVVDQVFLSEPGYLVVTTDPAEGEGRVLGHRSLGVGPHSGVRVGVDSDYWQSVAGNTTLRVRLYGDGGDGAFDPDRDPVLEWLGQPAGGPVTVRKGPAPVYLVPSGNGTVAADGTLSVDRVALAERGHVVVHDGTDASGSSLGHRTLDAGEYAGLAVPVESGVGNRSATVAVHRDDGDGEFDPDADPVVRVGDDPVASTLSLSVTGDDRIRVNTPTPTVARSTGTGTTDQPPRSPTVTDAGPTDGGTTTATGPGPGLLGAAVAALGGTLLVARRAWE